MTTQGTPNKCDGGHYTCLSPKKCCQQGCCYLLEPSLTRSPSLQTGNVFANPLFLGHWYFWLAVTATIAGILCACSLWRKHSQGGLCCRTGTNRNRTCSEPDSIGSCYAPPQYSSCNNFQAPPPPYSEVTSKPDMYPLVISCHAEPVIKNNNSSTGYLFQYFRSFIRIGSLSATSTNDSISSSFLCNAVTEANNLVPPTYSNVASLEELVLDSPAYPSPSSSERRLPRSTSSVSSATTEYHQVDFQVLQHSPSVSQQPKPPSNSGAQIAGIHLGLSLPNSNQNNGDNNRCIATGNQDRREESKTAHKAAPASTSPPLSTRERPMLRPRRPPPQRSQDSTEDEEVFSALLNLSICAPNSVEQAYPQATTILQDLGVTNSMTGSDISSLANLGTPDSPPRATSPTVEMRELLDKIQQLPAQRSPHPPSVSSSTTHGRSYFHRVRPKTMYMPLGEMQTVNSGKSQNKTIPNVFSKNWLSRSAPCTPCGALAPPFPSGRGSQKGSKTRISDGSPLLKQHAEETEEDPHRDVCL
ncbi:uncharacterized protein [Euwallacea similis]|uniref:uncharacterized protein isoform X2 n=1 Tax=Euwallacea similis TaxID=1736056 RepID=UPI00344DCC4C